MSELGPSARYEAGPFFFASSGIASAMAAAMGQALPVTVVIRPDLVSFLVDWGGNEFLDEQIRLFIQGTTVVVPPPGPPLTAVKVSLDAAVHKLGLLATTGLDASIAPPAGLTATLSLTAAVLRTMTATVGLNASILPAANRTASLGLDAILRRGTIAATGLDARLVGVPGSRLALSVPALMPGGAPGGAGIIQPLGLFSDEFTTMALDDNGDGSAPWATYFIQRNSRLLALEHDIALKAGPSYGVGLAVNRTLIFNADFADLSEIDMADTRATGFKFYRKQWFDGAPTPVTSIKQLAPSILQLGQVPGQEYYGNRGRIVSASVTTQGQHFGTTWGGTKGGYFEVRMRSSVPQIPLSGYFGLSLFDIEYLQDLVSNGGSHWSGRPANYGHFVEVDPFEFAGPGADGTTYAGKTNFQTTFHDWSGVEGSYSNVYNTNFLNEVGHAVDWTAFHTFGINWIPQASLSAVGSLQFYFDDTLLPGAVYWKNPNWPNPPTWPGSWPTTPQDRSTPALADALFSIIDTRHLAIQLDGHTECGMDVDFVRVWQ